MIKDIEFKRAKLELKQEGNDFVVTGYAAVFGNIDSYNDILVKGSMDKTLAESSQRIKLCYQHDIYEPVGKFNVLRVDDKGLYIEARISDAEPEIKTKISEGILNEFSIGYSTVKSETRTENGVNVRYLTEIKLWEISLVTLAANEMATVTGIKTSDFDELIEKEKDFEKKYALMTLKRKALEPGKPLEPQNDELKAAEIFYSQFKF